MKMHFSWVDVFHKLVGLKKMVSFLKAYFTALLKDGRQHKQVIFLYTLTKSSPLRLVQGILLPSCWLS